ncbi:MAG: hypothetical protein ACI89Z_000279 [Porticoccus sp.]|jgi:hypothetical protein
MTIRDWPEAERSREKLLEKGAEAFRCRITGHFSSYWLCRSVCGEFG